MSTIRCIYTSAPKFPATDQHPDAVRYQVGGLFVDAIGGEPTLAEVDAILSPVIDHDAECRKALDAEPANVNRFKLIKAKAISDLAFRLGVAPGALTGTQIAAERNRIAAIYAAL